MIDPVLSRLMLETLREAERDVRLRDRMGELMQSYRTLIVDLVRRYAEDLTRPAATGFPHAVPHGEPVD